MVDIWSTKLVGASALKTKKNKLKHSWTFHLRQYPRLWNELERPNRKLEISKRLHQFPFLVRKNFLWNWTWIVYFWFVNNKLGANATTSFTQVMSTCWMKPDFFSRTCDLIPYSLIKNFPPKIRLFCTFIALILWKDIISPCKQIWFLLSRI